MTQEPDQFLPVIPTCYYWWHTARFGLVKIGSRKPDYGLETSEQRNQDINMIDYETRIRSGWYNQGLAIRLGKTIGGKYYGVAIDFDGIDAILAWFGGWQNVLEYAKSNRVEWHKNPNNIHLIFYTDKPLQNRVIHISDGNQIEIKCEGALLRVSPSVHEDGNQFTTIDSEQIPIIRSLQLQAKIESISHDYMSDDDRESYVELLHNPNTVLGANCGRHAATVFIVNSYFWRYGGEWLDLSDDQRFERAWQWHIEHCKPPRPREEFDRICKDVVKKFRQQRDKDHEGKREQRRKYTDFENMPGCISYEINKGRYIVGTPDNKIAEITRKIEVDDNYQTKEIVAQIRTYTACKPIKVIRHTNPLSFLDTQDKFTIEFKGSEPSGCFTVKHKTLLQIVAEIKNINALADKGLECALTAQIKGFEKAGLLETNDSMDYTGFFPSDNAKIISSNVEIPQYYPDVTDALDYLHELVTKWYVGREDLLAHLLLWFMIAPCSFIFKVINAPLLDWMHLYGNPNTGKTSSGLIGLGLDGNENNENFNMNMKHIDSIARFGDTISDTTFPKIINEVDLAERDDIVTNIITAVDAVRFRKTLDRNRNAEYLPGLGPLFLTGNPKAPTKPEYVKRVKARYSTAKEVHLPSNPKAVEYKEWLAGNFKRGHTLGQFRNKFVTEHQDIILDTSQTPFEKSIKIWTAIYGSVGMKMPNFFTKKLEEHQMADSIEDRKSDISSALQAWIVDRCRSLDTNEHKILDEYQDGTDRLAKLIERNLVPYVRRDMNGNIIFYRQITVDLEHDYGLKHVDLAVLGDAIPGAKYGKLQDGYKVVKSSMTSLQAFFGEITPSDPSDRSDP